MANIQITNLTAGQIRALDSMLSGNNVFLTGEAGTGKSAVTEIFIEEAERSGKSVLVMAPTGTAADNLGGSTIHRCFKANIGIQKNNTNLSKRMGILRLADIIIIDEISMCRFDLFDYVARRILFENTKRIDDRRFAERRNAKFIQEDDKTYPVKPDDIQLIVIGDFYQLPPVISDNDKVELDNYYKGFDYGDGYAFESKCWDLMSFDPVMLTEVVRQKDETLMKVLRVVRHADQKNKYPCISWLHNESSSCEMDGDDSIFLFGTKKKCKERNDFEMEKLDTPEKHYFAEIDGEVRQDDKFSDDDLVLKKGCRVMLTINDQDERFVNGSIGVVKRLGNDAIDILLSESEQLVTVGMFTKEIIKPIERECETEERVEEQAIDEHGLLMTDKDGNPVMKMVTKKVTRTEISREKVGSFTQLPVIVAYAITIHKSQGKTFSKINLNPYAWDNGQFYTALSRCKTIENVYFEAPIMPKYIKTSANVKKFMRPIEKAASGSWL